MLDFCKKSLKFRNSARKFLAVFISDVYIPRFIKLLTEYEDTNQSKSIGKKDHSSWALSIKKKKSGNFGVNFQEILYGKKLFHQVASNFSCVEVRVA